MDFRKRIEEAKKARASSKFSGTLIDYLDILIKDPTQAELAHKRMYKLITEPGVDVINTADDGRLKRLYGNETIKKYDFFNEFYGIDPALAKVAKYFYSASMGGQEAKQVLYLVGPVGAGKSSLMETLKRALQEAPPIYHLKGCPMREEPLHLIPHHLRDEFSKELGVKIEGDLCPVCKYNLKELYKGDYEDFEVETTDFSIRSRKGIGVVPPVDPNNQDTSVLVGSIDISKLDKYSEDDPRALSLNGAFNVGNRGIVEFIEVFKNQTEYLHAMLTATQEKSIPSPGKGAMIYFDGIILAHSNEAEWNKFKSDHTNEAILDRIVKIEIPYTLELNEEIKIYEKALKESDFDAKIAPHTIEVASMFSILSRLAPSNKVDHMTKLKIYNGEQIVESGTTRPIDIKELQEENEREGMSGISTRFIMKALDSALAESPTNSITPISVMEALVKDVKEMVIASDEKDRLLNFIQSDIKKEYNKILEKEVTKAFIYGFREQAESLFNNYLDHSDAFVNKSKIKDEATGEELDYDEKFLRSIEEQMGVSESSAKGFRADVIAHMYGITRKGGTVDYKSYAPLKEAIEKKLTFSVKDIARIVTSTKVRDEKQSKKYNAMVEEMIANGYPEESVNAILKYAANNLWKD